MQDTLAQTVLMWSDHIYECVVEDDSQELEGMNRFNLAAFDTQLQGAASDLHT